MKRKLLRNLCLILMPALVAGCSKKTAYVINDPPVRTGPDTTAAAPSLGSTYQTYTLASANGGKFVEVSGAVNQGAKLNDGALIDQSGASINSSNVTDRWHEWIIGKQPNGYFTIMNLNGGKYLEVPGSSTTSGTTLDQGRENNSDNQFWSITAVGANVYKIINKVSTPTTEAAIK